ncbi:protein shisa-6 [Protopterus annectens]|uniref:protein shisa-6 n=1 Tax=Protopterus annectens TaxID=7888 RepID=UPI001CFA6576|nr:protein shisa-6 [Protopterus annectens]
MGIHYFLCLLIYLEPVIFLTAEATKVKSNKPPGSSKRPVPHPKGKDANSTSLATAAVVKAIKPQKTFKYDTCQGYYDVSGQWDSEFECNTTTHIYCCGSCSLRFCCPKKDERLDQKTCKIQSSPTTHTFTVPTTTDPYDPDKDKTNTTVYITAGVIAFILIAGVFAKVAYDKARRPPQEMTVHRALADILIQQGPIPIGHCERETIAAIDIALKEETSVISLAKNHFTPVRSSKPNHGSYGKDCNRSGGQNLHNFISSGFVTLGRGHLKGTVTIMHSNSILVVRC